MISRHALLGWYYGRQVIETADEHRSDAEEWYLEYFARPAG